jgi:alginate O-acetyltransferase complex protein AlgI
MALAPMVFSSIVFIFYFLPVFLLGYRISGWRVGVLLAGSVAFYVWGEGSYVFLLLGLVALNYAGALCVAATRDQRRGLGILAALVAIDFGVLAVFKYSGFVAANLNLMLPGAPLKPSNLRLPLGISFFTFQLVSYLVDVRRGAVKLERDPLRFAAYVMMFPHLIAGPIVRYADIREEMHGDRRRTARIGLGVQYFIVGLGQKVLIANIVAPLADYAFGLQGPALTTAAAWLGLWAYTLQIYFDFCGYSNMAIGMAFMLGFTFPKNFDYPYVSQSITEFWRRWHISLSSWFRDYLYIPLGGNRHGRLTTVRNLLIVFFLTGLWHGAAWQFIVWGLYHGAFLMLERAGFSRVLARLPGAMRRLYAVAVVAVGWVFFRAADLPRALGYLKAMAVLERLTSEKRIGLVLAANGQTIAALVVGSLLAVAIVPALCARLSRRRAVTEMVAEGPATLDVQALPVAALAICLLFSIAVLVGSSLNPFLYFRF